MSQSSRDDEVSVGHAPQVCRACKARKRKCDKTLPSCSSCVKRNVACEYGGDGLEDRPVVAAGSELPWPGSHSSNESPYVRSIDIPTLLFLDPSLLQHGQLDLVPATAPIPDGVLALLGGIDEIRSSAASFFTHIHRWMPFISQKRFYELHLRPSFHSQPDVVLLFLALKLITTVPSGDPRNPRTSLYYTVKHYHLLLEGSSVFSLLVLQVAVLIALYEVVHGIHPSAYLSVGACARYANALGINVRRVANTRRVVSLIEVEERRRIWWAIVILDRFVNIGSPGRPLATRCPDMDDLLPTNDDEWDQGIVRPEESFTMSQPMTTHMTKFALLCQAARLLGQVLQCIANDTATPDDDMWRQLERTLWSMWAASKNVEDPDEDQMTLIYSALVALYVPWTSSDPAHSASPEGINTAKHGLQRIVDKVSMRLASHDCFIDRDPENIPPWGHYFAYQITKVLMRCHPQNVGIRETLKHLRDAFVILSNRWCAAGVYLQLIEAQEINNQP